LHPEATTAAMIKPEAKKIMAFRIVSCSARAKLHPEATTAAMIKPEAKKIMAFRIVSPRRGSGRLSQRKASS
jgi:hypothetical protein